jgi:two-component system chemotaxis sensor kinase CheA
LGSVGNTRMEDQELIHEFLVESYENLSSLDQKFVELEKHPKDAALLASVFRTIHTIKGTCGFLAFTTLETIAHQAESILSQVRDGKRELNVPVVSLIFETADAIRKGLASIEADGEEGPDRFENLTERLRVAALFPEGPDSRSVTCQDDDQDDDQSDIHTESRDDLHTDAADSEPQPEEGAAKSSAVADASIRVGVGLLDKLMDLVGELALTRNQILRFNAERGDAALNATSQRLNLITNELQAGVMKTRMQPIGMVWNKLPRVVRDIAVALGKQIWLEMDGGETELDRTIIEAIKDPLVHLVRNACDHGIELPEARVRAGKKPLGRLTLRAWYEGGQVNIEIGDDGAGIDMARVRKKAVESRLLRPEQAQKLSDLETLNLIFLPGFSTVQTVTNVSGRGVGMDVVKSHIERIGGIVDAFSRPGEGTTIKIKIPGVVWGMPGAVANAGLADCVLPLDQIVPEILLRVNGAPGTS